MDKSEVEVEEEVGSYSHPKPINSKRDEDYYWYAEFDKKEVDDYIKNFFSYDISQGLTGKTVYVQDKNISQSKLRDKGFKITRSKAKADFVIVKTNPFMNVFTPIKGDDYVLNRMKDRGHKVVNKNNYYKLAFGENDPAEELVDYAENIALKCKHVLISDIYKTMYSYEGNLELFENLSSLLKSNDRDNTKMAMEMMSNANWEGNDIYLKELFSLYWLNNMRSNEYKTSISFKGFLASLDFNPNNINFRYPNDYRDDCANDEHHKFVYDKFFHDFDTKLQDLIENYKIKIDNIEYSIDKRTTDEIYPKTESEDNQ